MTTEELNNHDSKNLHSAATWAISSNEVRDAVDNILIEDLNIGDLIIKDDKKSGMSIYVKAADDIEYLVCFLNPKGCIKLENWLKRRNEASNKTTL